MNISSFVLFLMNGLPLKPAYIFSLSFKFKKHQYDVKYKVSENYLYQKFDVDGIAIFIEPHHFGNVFVFPHFDLEIYSWGSYKTDFYIKKETWKKIAKALQKLHKEIENNKVYK